MTLAELAAEIEYARETLYEAQLRGETEGRLSVLRARVRQAEDNWEGARLDAICPP